MANIPVQEKSSKTWLWLLLAAIIIGLLLWWLLDNDDGDVVEYTDNDTVAEDTVGNANAMAAAFTVGETVDLENARVTELVGDMAFRIESEGREALVLFNEERTPGDPTEGEYDINVGQTVSLNGTVMSGRDPMPEGVDATLPSGMTQYIYAESMSIEDRPAN